MITVDMSKYHYWILSGKTHAISGGVHLTLHAAQAAAVELAKKEGSEVLIVRGYGFVIPTVETRWWP